MSEHFKKGHANRYFLDAIYFFFYLFRLKLAFNINQCVVLSQGEFFGFSERDTGLRCDLFLYVMKPVSGQSSTHQNMRLRRGVTRRVKMDFSGESDPGIKPGFFILKDRIINR